MARSPTAAPRYNESRSGGSLIKTSDQNQRSKPAIRITEQKLAEDKLYKAEYVGSGTFIISKPSRKKTKMRQTKLKNVKRGSRK
jgi:hypothetical protein